MTPRNSHMASPLIHPPCALLIPRLLPASIVLLSTCTCTAQAGMNLALSWKYACRQVVFGAQSQVKPLASWF
jgi:hypothetical protein